MIYNCFFSHTRLQTLLTPMPLNNPFSWSGRILFSLCASASPTSAAWFLSIEKAITDPSR
jgi:hypothetical protein